MELSHIHYESIKENALHGRYITYEHISVLLGYLSNSFKVTEIGRSVNGLPIHSITFGHGMNKILMWSQMHGNESTTTKAIFDLLNVFGTDLELFPTILKNCTIKIIPMLNPDGAKAYTRLNANLVDLNRDAQDRSQPESKILRNCFEDFNPDFCFNLHGQRTIFNVGNTPKPATISFLAPAFDENRSISESRAKSMRLIVAMDQVLQKLIPGQIGRYDDGFNANCVGDTFQMLNVPTILFEAGHYPKDYDREETRRFIFMAMVSALQTISEKTLKSLDEKAYFNIPDNNKLFYDILIRNAHLIEPKKYKKGATIALLYKEVLQNGKIAFDPVVEKVGSLKDCFGHKTFDCSNESDFASLKSESFWNEL
ncbi:M14 family metallopeptidase [Maribacter arenosus]|uniref:Peptidase M14 n=1 Tax=Maribacter arenosus TaxID=1854708 RepID=A0ABR7VBH4_9FLAO|nr:M14 metallopeptidase family protein [Maribacter arenosus]MBD0849404.1 peptidase M14 [Maribacter arenosus]